jgi:hypothetical protein
MARSAYRNSLTALLRPSNATYKMLGQQRAGLRHAYLLVFASSLLGGLIESLGPFGSQLIGQGSFDVLLLAMIPLAALIAVCSLAAFAWCSHFVARLLKGTGAQAQLTYVLAAISAPLLIVVSVVDQLPAARILLVAIYIYWLVQYTQAIRAVHGLGWVKATAAVLLALLMLGVACLGIAFLVGYSGILLP